MAEKTSAKPTEVPEVAQKLGEELVSAVKQSQSLALNAARTFAGAWPSTPSRLSDLPGADLLPDFPALTAYGYDLAAELLAAQKDFTVKMAATLGAGKDSG
ncbi:hypothetical protein [Mycobacterium intracellulare]|uniref:hypothetical protein n=1 Tax=Mycobacterium intracellulare TaxID=1767 RepID=UPI00109EAF2F|nr:hypothetical protein [Mycobacterium intracellulare]